MKIIICGGRHFNNFKALEIVMENILAEKHLDCCDVEIVSGHCEGADKLGERYAKENGCGLTIFKANWSRYGRSAGPIRNKEMIDYIKTDESNLVVAFVSPNSVGTKNTIKLAKAANLEVYEIPYNINEESYELYEGINRSSEGDFLIDWENNNPSDIVKFTSSCAHITKFNKNIRCYGYRINKQNADKDDVSDFLKDIKNNPNKNDYQELISRCIEDFFEICPIKHFDYIAKLPSRSFINTAICDIILNSYDNPEEIELSKNPTSMLEFNWDKFNRSFKGSYYDKMVSFINRFIERLKSDEHFSISKIPPQYRPYFKSMIKVGNDKIACDNTINILIIDDTFTTGSTLNMVFEELADLGFKGNIITLTLLNNR